MHTKNCERLFGSWYLGWLVVITLLCMVTTAGESLSQATLEQLDSIPTNSRVGFIADALRVSASATKGLVFELDIAISGTQSESTFSQDEEKYVDGPNGKGKIVTSLKRGFATTDTNPLVRCISLFDGINSKSIYYEKNRITQVSVDCKAGYCPDEFANFCRITGASGWRDGPDRACTNDVWTDFIRGMKFEGFETIGNMGRVAILTKKYEGRSSVERWYFGGFEKQLVWLGNEFVSESLEPAITDWGERIARTVNSTQYDYSRINGHAIPSRWTVSIVSETLKPDRSPMAPPRVLRKSNIKVKSCKILPQFPDHILNIAIPSDARIFDDCAERQQRAVAKEVIRSQTDWKWWILAAGIGLCASAIATWRYVRK